MPPRTDVGTRRRRQLTDQATSGSSNREGLVLLADCAVSRPPDVSQVKVEPEVVLSDYELTAMKSPEASMYERKRMAAAETTPTVGDFHLQPPVTGSRSRSPYNNGGRQTLDNGRIECLECGRQYSSAVAYNKHVIQVHRLAMT